MIVSAQAEMTPAGGRTVYTVQVRKRLFRSLLNAGTYTTAAAVAGIGRRTLSRWLKEKPDFKEVCEIARDRSLGRLIKKISANKDWRALAWLVDHGYAGEYSPAASGEGPRGEKEQPDPADQRNTRNLNDIIGKPKQIAPSNSPPKA
jgi:hypothetical protein